MNHRPDSYPCESGAHTQPVADLGRPTRSPEPGADWLVTVRPMKLSAARKIGGWFLDYCYLVYWMIRGHVLAEDS